MDGGNTFSGSTSGDFFKTVKKLHNAILVGLLVIIAIIYFAARNGKEQTGSPLFLIAGPVVGLGTIAAAYFIPTKMMSEASRFASLGQKLTAWHGAHILKLALLEGGAIVNILFFYLSGDMTLLIFAGLAALVIVLNTPGVYRITTMLNLNESEQRCLENPENIIP